MEHTADMRKVVHALIRPTSIATHEDVWSVVELYYWKASGFRPDS